MSWYSAAGTFALLALVGYYSGALAIAIKELPWLLAGRADLIIEKNFSVLEMALTITAAVSLSIVLSFIGIGIQHLVLGKTKDSYWSGIGVPVERPLANIFMFFFVWAMAEEVFARGIFLGILPRYFQGPFAFQVLFLLGNGLWAILHKYNFRHYADQKNLRTLPQFLMGIIFSYIFVKYGLLASVLAHFGHNAIMAALNKNEKFKPIYLVYALYFCLGGIICYLLQTQPMAAALSWFVTVPAFKLAGWNFWNYVCLDLFVLLSTNGIMVLLAYDGLALNSQAKNAIMGRLNVQKDLWQTNRFACIKSFVLVPVWGAISAMGLTLVLFWISGFFTDNLPYRIITLTLLLCFLQAHQSMNGMAKSFWVNLPSTYLLICVIQALANPFLIFAFLCIRITVIMPSSFILLRQKVDN